LFSPLSIIQQERAMNTVKLMIRVKDGEKYPYSPAEVSKNGKVKPVEGATYHMRYTENGKRKLVSIGDDAAEAAVMCAKQQAILNATAAGVAVLGATKESKAPRILLTAAIEDYLTEVKEHKANRTHLNYKHALAMFTEGCKVMYVDQVGRACMMNYAARLRKEGYADRSVSNYFGFVFTFLKRHGLGHLIGKNDWPKYEETEADIYTEADVLALLAACKTPKEKMLIMFASNTGFRHAEISHAEIMDVDYTGKTVQTRSRPSFAGRPKTTNSASCPAL
jgi:hypothetical protein